jgi:hypothetical protein
MEREIGSERAHLPHEFRVKARGLEDGKCEVCDEPMDSALHHVERVTQTAADAGPALITEKGS